MDEKRFSKVQQKEITQNVIMENRRKLSISGVTDVESFDEETIVLSTEAGMLIIKGSALHINKLSLESGEVAVEGEIDALNYSDEETKNHGSILSKIFR